jgi:hypothetical protein
MQYDDHMQLIICKALRVIGAAPDHDDMRRNTDFQLIYQADPTMHRIAARVRRAEYFDKHFHEITFRHSLPSGVETEWQKMLHGYGDYMIYGFAADNHGDRLRSWVVLNLHIFRQHVSEDHVNRWRPTRQHNRPDRGGEEFLAYPILNMTRCPRCLGAVLDDVVIGDDGRERSRAWLAAELHPELLQPTLWESA